MIPHYTILYFIFVGPCILIHICVIYKDQPDATVFSLLLFNTLHVSGFAHPQEYMKLFLQPNANVMLYLGGPMLLSSAVLWFVYLRYLVYLGILAMFFFRCYWLYPCVWLCLVVGVWCWFFFLWYAVLDKA